MRFSAPKEAWVKALRVVSPAIGSKDGEDKVKAHVVFRIAPSGKAVEVLASNGERLCASAPIEGVEVDGAPGEMCTAPASRLNQLINAIRDGRRIEASSSAGTLTVSVQDGGKVRSNGRFVSLDPVVSQFPFWDKGLASAAQVCATVATRKLSAGLLYCRNFSTEQTRNPNLAATECRDGLLTATNQVAVCLVEIPEIAASKMRIEGGDVRSVVSFLKLIDTTEIRETDRTTYFLDTESAGPDNLRATFGVTRWPKELPALKVDREDPDICSFVANISDIQDAMGFLEACAKKDDPYFAVRTDATELLFAMSSASGADGEDSCRVDTVESTDLDKLAEKLASGAFYLNEQYLRVVVDNTLKSFKGQSDPEPNTPTPATSPVAVQPTIRFGLNWTPKNGFTRFRHQSDGVDYLTLLVWLRKK